MNSSPGRLDDLDADAAELREQLGASLLADGVLGDPAWRKAVERVPRHLFTPGFYLPGGERDAYGLPLWEPVTAVRDYQRWLSAAYSDATLITQFDGTEPDWASAAVRHGGVPTSSSTLPSLVVRMWDDAEIDDGHHVLEIGTGAGYSTALACDRLGSGLVTSVEVDARRLDQAADSLYSCGYVPSLAVADGAYGYWPEAPYDRIVAACSFRHIPPALIAQTRPGGKILVTLGGWLHGYARVLLTVSEDGTADGPLLDGTVSFMPARTHAAPAFGDPARWAARITGAARTPRHTPERFSAPTDQAFQLRYLVQTAVPNAQTIALGDTTYLVDVVSGSAATLTRDGDRWQVRESGALKLWDRVEDVLDAYDAAGRPRLDAFRLHVGPDGQTLRHPQMPPLTLPFD
ncbi:ATP-grasp peptide maturase system methyltransferase [Yinghuangia soli]|uniref:Protein-L-isoaspartate O-methyltransferase n=1 Tax=Yinghuangia soli TaxID=2908204 RepID=A0AA41U2U6_9ACTN|nr:ATP-grasp peptide maturase system methyltransferase [Yinghuangia soli]MCF2532138.1 ATP-grasp peptide maturase system methyltransferase [Yinghuangia soli]